MAMGIDQEIQRRMDAYRGNPQGLQKRYQMSQQLLDLLALQKLKSEKDAMARQMQAQMQQTPSNVAQQMQQEMVGRTKNEMLQQVDGVMRQQAAQQQRAMAARGQQPQGGIAGLAPQSAQRMAGGGVVAFSNGALVGTPSQYGAKPFSESPVAKGIEFLMDPFQSRRKEVLQGLRDRLARGEQLPPQMLEALAEYEQEFPGIQGPGKPDADLLARRRRLATQAAPGVTEPAGGMAGVDDREGPPDLAPGPDTGVRDMGGAGIMIDGQPLDAQGRAQERAQPAPGRSGAFDQVREAAPTKVAEESPMAQEIRTGIRALRGRGDPRSEMRGLGSYAEELLGRTAKKDAGMDRAARLEALGAPTMSQRERLLNVLSAAGGATNIGTMGARMARADLAARAADRAAEQQFLKDVLGMEEQAEARDVTLGVEALKAGKTGYEQGSLNRRAAEDLAMRLGADETKRIIANSRAELDALIANQRIDIEDAKAVAARALEAVKQRGQDRRALEDRLTDVQKTRADFYTEILKSSDTYMGLLGNNNPDAVNQRKELEEEALLKANAWSEAAGINAAEARLENRLRELGVGGGGGNRAVLGSRMISQ